VVEEEPGSEQLGGGASRGGCRTRGENGQNRKEGKAEGKKINAYRSRWEKEGVKAASIKVSPLGRVGLGSGKGGTAKNITRLSHINGEQKGIGGRPIRGARGVTSSKGPFDA